jgi:hypothetical protein
VDEIDRADVQGGGYAHLPAALHEPLDEIEAGLPIVPGNIPDGPAYETAPSSFARKK